MYSQVSIESGDNNKTLRKSMEDSQQKVPKNLSSENFIRKSIPSNHFVNQKNIAF